MALFTIRFLSESFRIDQPAAFSANCLFTRTIGDVYIFSMGDEGVFSPEDRENFKNAFDAFDDDRDDRVATDVLGKLLRAVGFNPLPEEVEDMVGDINEPTFDFNSFLYILFRHAREADPEGELIDSFKVFDKTGSGKLKTTVIRQILGNLKQPFTDDQISELLGQAEVDANDEVVYADFVKVMLDF